MLLTPNEKKILGHDYTCVVHTGSEGLELLSNIMNYVAIASDSLKNLSGIKIESLSQLTEEEGIKIITTLVQMLPAIMDKGFLKFTLKMLANTTRDGQSLNDVRAFDAIFAGNFSELFAALAWVIYVNFYKDIKNVFTNALNQLKTTGYGQKFTTLLSDFQKS